MKGKESEAKKRSPLLYQKTYDKLCFAIACGEFKPGEHLKEGFLADYLNVSRTPVRTAIMRLEKEGLVKRVCGRAIVEKIEEKDIKDILEIRETLEKLAIAEAVSNTKGQDIAYLKEANDRFECALLKQDVFSAVREDEGFHDIIYQSSGNNALLGIIRDFEKILFHFRIKSLDIYKERRILSEEHREIISALEEADGEAATAAVCRHICRQRDTILGHK